MPSAAAMARSRGVVTKPRTRSALAPTYTVVTVMDAFSLRGYWRTLTVRIACNPAIRITRFTTMASTGRLINRSVKDFMRNSVIPWLAIRRFRLLVRFRHDVVVLRDSRAVAQFEKAGAG